MDTSRRITLIACTAFALTALVTSANAQPYGPGTMMGPGMMGPGMMGPGGFGRMCNPAAAGFAEWRVDRLEQLIKPTDAQRSKFDELKTASNKAADIIRGACPTDFPKTAVARLDVMEKHADAMLQAIKTVRPAMEAFYATLNDEQKAKLDSNSGRGRFWRWRDNGR